MRLDLWMIAACVCLSVSICEGRTVEPDPKTNQPNPNVDQTQPQGVQPLEEINISQPPETRPSSPPFFYRYQKSISGYGGAIVDNSPDGTAVTYGIFGTTYLWHSPTSTHMESGVEALTNGRGNLWTAVRVNSRSTERFRTFWSAGFGIKLIADKQLATFLYLSNYYFRIAGGFELSLFGPLSLRTEISIAPDFQGHGSVCGTSGLTWGFD